MTGTRRLGSVEAVAMRLPRRRLRGEIDCVHGNVYACARCGYLSVPGPGPRRPCRGATGIPSSQKTASCPCLLALPLARVHVSPPARLPGPPACPRARPPARPRVRSPARPPDRPARLPARRVCALMSARRLACPVFLAPARPPGREDKRASGTPVLDVSSGGVFPQSLCGKGIGGQFGSVTA